MQIGIIGYGVIGRTLLQIMGESNDSQEVVGILVRPGKRATFDADTLAKHTFVESMQELIDLAPDVVVECAGHQAVIDYCPLALAAGIDTVIISIGAMADKVIYDCLYAIAEKTDAQIFLPAGAIAGIDGLYALKMAGLDSVEYISVKPPHAWLGTPAEQGFDLHNMAQRTVVFEGSARDAALQFPMNANIAAIVGFAGVGLDDTRVSLVADPGVSENTGIVRANSSVGSVNVEACGLAAGENAKTSISTAFSIARTLRNRVQVIVI